MSTFLSTLLQALLPAVCPVCTETDGVNICEHCIRQLPAIEQSCPACAAPLPEYGATCHCCSGMGFPGISELLCHWHYSGTMKLLIHNAKRRGKTAAIRTGCQLLTRTLPEKIPADAIVVIPPSTPQADKLHLGTELGRAIARLTQIPLIQPLQLTHRPHPQHQLSEQDRKKNMNTIFQCSKTVPRRILLVDDILTTGTSLIAGARALRQQGSKNISGICLARTIRYNERSYVDNDTKNP